MKIEDAVGARQKEIELSGEITAVDFGHDFLFYVVRNDGEDPIYVSTENKECTAGDNGVVAIYKGGSYVHYNGYGGSTEIYLSGTGKATIIAQDNGDNPFKSAQGGGEFEGTLDDIPDGENYYKLGYFVQAGQVTAVGSSAISVTFPKIFGSTPFIFLAYLPARYTDSVPVVKSASASGFDINKDHNTDTVNWIAFGKLPT